MAASSPATAAWSSAKSTAAPRHVARSSSPSADFPRHATGLAKGSTGSAVRGAAVAWRCGSVVHAVVADHAGDPQPIFGARLGSATDLGAAMRLEIAPRFERGFIAKERQREDLAGLGQALEPLD